MVGQEPATARPARRRRAPRARRTPSGQPVSGTSTDAVRVLLAEADARPGVDQRRVVVAGSDRVVAHVALVDPARGRGAVEVAKVLRLLDGVPGELDPDVVAPDRVRARSAEQVADRAAVAERRPSPRRPSRASSARPRPAPPPAPRTARATAARRRGAPGGGPPAARRRRATNSSENGRISRRAIAAAR